MWKIKSKKYFIGLIPYFDRVMQNKKMKKIRLNNNQKLQWGNKFEDMFRLLKALSLGAPREAEQFLCTKPSLQLLALNWSFFPKEWWFFWMKKGSRSQLLLYIYKYIRRTPSSRCKLCGEHKRKTTSQKKPPPPPPPKKNFSNANLGILLSTMGWAKISLVNTTKNHLAQITRKLDPI